VLEQEHLSLTVDNDIVQKLKDCQAHINSNPSLPGQTPGGG
jgi:hypothetical protein